jgi:hypothetical protein
VRRWALAILAGVVLAGCSGVRLVYDNADVFIRWRVLQFLDVHGEQADELDERIARFMRWHRTNALPTYARDAEEGAQRLSRGLTRGDLVWAYDIFTGHGREAMRAAAEQMAPLLDRLTPEQLQHMEQRVAEENRKFAREYLRGSERERREQRAQRIVIRLEDWLGTLSKAQIEAVRQYSARAALNADARDRDNKRIQGEILAVIRAGESRKRLAETVISTDKRRDPAFAAVRQASLDEFYSLVLEIDRLSTPEQRARVISELRRYAAEFRGLAARSQ